MLLLFNTLNIDRFDHLNCVNSTDSSDKFDGYCMSSQMGRSAVDKNFLSKSHSSAKISFVQSIYSCEIENRFYIAEISTKSG